jgi:hypothetical protein
VIVFKNMDMTPSVICTSEQQNEAINFEPHRVSNRQGILGCFHKLKNQDFSGDHAEAVFFREIFYLDDRRHRKRRKLEG